MLAPCMVCYDTRITNDGLKELILNRGRSQLRTSGKLRATCPGVTGQAPGVADEQFLTRMRKIRPKNDECPTNDEVNHVGSWKQYLGE